MKNITKWIACITLILCLILPTVCVGATDVAAVSTGFTSASDVIYKTVGAYVANWGARGEDATFLSTYAQQFYKGDNDFDIVSNIQGGTTQNNAPSSPLYSELQDIMKSAHTHETDYGETRYLYQYTDCVKNNNSQISSFYSGKMFGSTWDAGKTWNREHTWPNSKGDLSGNGENDIMMLRPTLKSENGSRSNRAYGVSSAYYNPNGESGGKYDLRGDVSRIILYQYVRWGCINTGSKYNPNNIFGTSGVIESLDVLLLWMEQDPVDTWEMGRNDAVQSITGTRNVFVDYPEYAWLLFGEEYPENLSTPSGEANNTEEHTFDNEEDLFCNVCGIYKVIEPTLLKQDGVWYYYVDGYKSTDSALVNYNGKTYYVIGGVWSSKITDTLYKIDGKWHYIKDGKFASTETTLVKYNGKWYHVKNGLKTTSTTLVKYNSKWYYVEKGVKKTATKLVKYSDKYYYVKDGKVNFTTGIKKIGSKYYYIKDGKWSSTKNTLYKNNGKYYVVKNGMWYKSKAIFKYSGKQYYVNNGYVQTGFTGKVKTSTKTYKIKKGIVQ
jgi:hypothetical protein